MEMETKSALCWQSWLIHGDKYLKASKPRGVKNRFGTEIVYNLLSMSLESYIMAIMDFHQKLPENHTYTDLFRGLDTVMNVDPVLKARILQYENIQSICSIEKYHRTSPSHEEIDDLKDALIEIRDMAHLACQTAA